MSQAPRDEADAERDPPPEYIIQKCESLGFHAPRDCPWLFVIPVPGLPGAFEDGSLEEGYSILCPVCTRARDSFQLAVLRRHLRGTPDSVTAIYLGQCDRCHTCLWTVLPPKTTTR